MPTGLLHRFREKLAAPQDAASLALFRITFGIMMLYHYVGSWNKGHFHDEYLSSDLQFTYAFATWLPKLPEPYLIGAYWALIVFAFLFTVGFAYRTSIILFTLLQTYFFFVEAANYLNHMYMAWLLAVLLCCVPAAKIWSIDSWLHNRNSANTPHATIPYWCIAIFAIQLEIILLYAGIAKINPEWLGGYTLRAWLQSSRYWDIVQYAFSYEFVIMCATYTAILIHLVGAPLLLFKKTRVYAFFAYCGFHFANHYLFPAISIFPFMTITATTLVLDPSWPRKMLVIFNQDFGIVRSMRTYKESALKPMSKTVQYGFGSALTIWLIIQAIIPARHYVLDGYVYWDRLGHQFSWQMMLIDREVDKRWSRISVCSTYNDKPKCHWVQLKHHLGKEARKELFKYPDLTIQFAHFMRHKYEEHGYENIKVYAWIAQSISGRKLQYFFYPDADLSRADRSVFTQQGGIIMPIIHPLPKQPGIFDRIDGKKGLRDDYAYWEFDGFPKDGPAAIYKRQLQEEEPEHEVQFASKTSVSKGHR